MTTLTFQIQSAPRPDGLTTDDALGEHLVALCHTAIARRTAGPAALVVRSDRVDFVAMGGDTTRDIPVKLLLAALTRMDLRDDDTEVEAVGVIGVVGAQRGPGPAIPLAITFLEWTDCRWWHWQALMDAEGREVAQATETVRSALDGDPKPLNLGGWWTLARHRTDLKLKLRALVH